MAWHDFTPSWLNFPTPPSSRKSSLNLEKHSENFSWTENHYEANRRRHNSSDGCDPNSGWRNGGHLGKKEKSSWHSFRKRSTENINHREGYHGGGYHARTSTFHCGKGQRLRDTSVPERETGKKEDKAPKQFEAEDFPSLNPEYEREPKQSKSLAAGVWEYPLNPKFRSQRMLVIKKGSTKELQKSGGPVVGNLYSQPVKNGTGSSVCKGLVPKPVTPLAKRNWSNSSSPVDKIGKLCLTKLTRMRSDKKSEFLKELKQDKVEEEEHKDKNHSGQEKDDESFNLHNSNSSYHKRDTNQNFERDNPQENVSASVTFQQMIQSSSFHQADFLSSFLEAEHRLLKEMGWQEESENDEIYAPLTEEEMREFQTIKEQLQKNGLRKNGILKNCLTHNFKFSPWKNSTFRPAPENEDSETSSSDTSDDDDL